MSIITVNTAELETGLAQAMRDVQPLQLGAMKKRIADAIEKRREFETAGGKALSKDFRALEDWNDSEPLARMFAALKIDVVGYICNPMLSDADIEKRGFQLTAKTRNLKAYKKTREVAEYVWSGSNKLENVAKSFTACMVQASRFQNVVTRDEAKRFLSSFDLSTVSPELAEAIAEAKAQAVHMSTGADTQTSQMTLTLASLGALTVHQNGRSKSYTVNAEHPIYDALCERFGMTDALHKVRERQARTA